MVSGSLVCCFCFFSFNQEPGTINQKPMSLLSPSLNLSKIECSAKVSSFQLLIHDSCRETYFVSTNMADID